VKTDKDIALRRPAQDEELRADLQREFATALVYHAAGWHNEAALTYKKILRAVPRHAEILHLLGVIEHQAGNHTTAAQLIDQAMRQRPNQAKFWASRGSVYHSQGYIAQAESSYRKTILLCPDFSEVYNKLGQLFEETGRMAEAEAVYRCAASVQPSYFQPRGNMVRLFLSQGRLEEAEEELAHILEANPNQADAFNSLGIIRRKQGHLEQAEASLRGALTLSPNYADAHSNLAAVLKEQGRQEEAEQSWRRALALNPDLRVPQSVHKSATPQARPEEDEGSLRRILAGKPDYAEAHNNLAVVLKAQGKLEEAEQSIRRALAIRPDYPGAKWTLGTILLTAGKLAQGWSEYESRLPANPGLLYDFGIPIWRGEDLRGRAILLTSEQGLGDTLQFVRYAPLVAQRGAKVFLLVPEPLRRLLRDMEGVEHVFATTDILPQCDFSCPLLSLPQRFGTEIDTVPARIPYINVDPQAIALWGKRLTDESKNKLRVGLVWAGNPRWESGNIDLILTDARRSLRLQQMTTLFEVSDVVFYSLQKNASSMEAQYTPRGMRLVDHSRQFQDFSDTAALIMNLDLIISVDTSVAHLAGALGKPVWVLNRFDTCWRWLLQREDSPWYPTMRLFRQAKPGDWGPVVDRVKQALLEKSATHMQPEMETGIIAPVI
jgi:Flp pilus assembly protein TadD